MSTEQHGSAEQETVESIVPYIPWVIPLVGALLIFLLAFIAVTMA